MIGKAIGIEKTGTLRVTIKDGQRSDALASLFSLANGQLGVLGVVDERAAAPCVILPQIFVTRPISYHEQFPGYAQSTDTRVLCPSPLGFDLLVDGNAFDFASATCDGAMIRCTETGQLRRNLVWTDKQGKQVRVEAVRIVPVDSGVVVATRLEISALNFSATLRFVPKISGHDAGSEQSDDPRISARLQQNWQISEVSVLSDTARSTVVECPEARLHYLESFGGEADWNADGGTLGATATAGSPLIIERIVQIGSDGCPAPLGKGFAELAQTAQNAAAAFMRHAPAIEGDDQLTGALRYSLAQVIEAAPASDEFSIAAKGLSGEGYEGHYFWDTEAFMLPVIALHDPDRARNLLAYRISKLENARNHARGMGHATGALYPWRTIAGDECSSHYPTGSAQYHINGDIVFAIDLYCDVTGDDQFLFDSAEAVFETARIWPQIGQFDAGHGGAFCLYGVTGPDEYSALVDNDYYTNAIARRHLYVAVKLASRMQAERPSEYRSLVDRIGLTDQEIAVWAKAADRMLLPFDRALGISAQDDTFLAKPRMTEELLAAAAGKPLLMQYHPLVLFRHQVAKQGNVIQATAMGLARVPASTRARNFTYYNDVTVHDSTLSPVAFAIEAARLGMQEDALAFLREVAFVDLHDRHGNVSHGLHMAAAAGTWLAMSQGWAGMAIGHGTLSFAPRIPAEWKSYRLSVLWRGSRIQLAVDQTGTTYSLLEGPPLELRDHGRVFELGDAPVAMPHSTLKAVVFDLDGVLTDTAEDHFEAWSALARNHGMQFGRHDNEAIKGVERAGSLQFILDKNGATVDQTIFDAMLREKNADYLSRIDAYDPSRLFPGILDLLDECHQNGILVAVASASRNAPLLLSKLGILEKFDYVANAGEIPAPKPAPDIFLDCARALGVSPSQCVGVEDSQAGISGIVAAGMASLGVGSSETLPEAIRCIADTNHLTLSLIQSAHSEFSANNQSGSGAAAPALGA